MILRISIRRMLIYTSKVFILFLILLILIIYYNNFSLNPTDLEKNKLKSVLGNKIYLNNDKDIINLQNFIVKTVIHGDSRLEHNPININKVLDNKIGLCYEKSLILQKVMIINNIKIRPVYLYHLESKENSTSLLHLLNPSLKSHSIFEIYWKESWYVIETVGCMSRLSSLEEYLVHQNIFKSPPKYIRYLNNRNGKFIYPEWIPDVYYCP